MHVGLIQVAEPLESDDGIGRPYRAGMLARALVSAGHEVTWWTSNFNHVNKTFRFASTDVVAKDERGIHFRFLHGRPYRRNISLARIGHQRDMAAQLGADLDQVEPVDVFFVGIPIHELAAVVATQAPATPLVLDVRDTWPDLLVTAVPAPARPLARIALRREFADARRNFRHASGVVGVSGDFLAFGLRYAGRPAAEFDRVFSIGHPSRGERRPSPATDGPLRLVFGGAFGASVDMDTIIAAVQSVVDSRPGAVHLTIAGDGDQASQLRGMVRPGDPIDFVGWLAPDELRSLVRSADVGVLPYRTTIADTMPNKLFEYLAWGMPLLSSLTGDGARLIESHALGEGYRAGDVASAAAGIERLIAGRTQLGAVGDRAVDVFDTEFAEERIYPEMSRYLEAVAASRSRR
jgi:glycosyltransferase involved in cell wall biosynthesis